MPTSIVRKCLAVAGLLAMGAAGQPLPPAVKAKVEAKTAQIQSWSTDPVIVAAVRAYNAAPPAEAKGMTNEKWKGLTLLDPVVRSFTRNPLAEHLKRKRDDSIGEIFVSAADGSKVAFLSKTTYWNHKGKDKHDVPMTGRAWIGPLEVDGSTGFQMVQVGIPVLDGGKPIGSIVIGFKASALQ